MQGRSGGVIAEDKCKFVYKQWTDARIIRVGLYNELLNDDGNIKWNGHREWRAIPERRGLQADETIEYLKRELVCK